MGFFSPKGKRIKKKKKNPKTKATLAKVNNLCGFMDTKTQKWIFQHTAAIPSWRPHRDAHGLGMGCWEAPAGHSGTSRL